MTTLAPGKPAAPLAPEPAGRGVVATGFPRPCADSSAPWRSASTASRLTGIAAKPMTGSRSANAERVNHIGWLITSCHPVIGEARAARPPRHIPALPEDNRRDRPGSPWYRGALAAGPAEREADNEHQAPIFGENKEVNGCFRDTEDMLRNGDRRGGTWMGTMSAFSRPGRWLPSSEWTRRRLPGGQHPAASAASGRRGGTAGSVSRKCARCSAASRRAALQHRTQVDGTRQANPVGRQ